MPTLNVLVLSIACVRLLLKTKKKKEVPQLYCHGSKKESSYSISRSRRFRSRKKGEGVGAPFPPYSLSTPDILMEYFLVTRDRHVVNLRVRRRQRIAEPMRPRCPATKTFAPLSMRKEKWSSGSAAPVMSSSSDSMFAGRSRRAGLSLPHPSERVDEPTPLATRTSAASEEAAPPPRRP
jgi:hypothetical protein